ncbi:G-D-S-L family lipolytic protein [Paenibacillus sp. CAA11]|uniref:rhamnogalacturonan lyase family protein n=1 Tax=Paenibacillus sp. CAA11 TaxID=1532905 RepID=UPI000D3B91AB|nr:SGNH/GDSL hydrolase family protein [Paenibacillus sp. CAA11]AWB46910.1 G-D-S-L family lipolytic protein [Paenibacillus sp. CAA11]
MKRKCGLILFLCAFTFSSLGWGTFFGIKAVSAAVGEEETADVMMYKYDFGSGDTAEGYTTVAADTAYTAESGYGFTDLSKVTVQDRGTDDPLRSDFALLTEGAGFNIDLPNGDYTVSLIAGDPQGNTDIAIKVESMDKVLSTAKAAGEYLEMSIDIALVDGQMNFLFAGAAAKLNSLTIKKLPDREAGSKPVLYLVGDSTMQTYDPYWQPQAGYGQMLPSFFSDAVEIKNHSIGGRSSKSFIVQGRLDEILRVIRPGDYLLVQFGHNDATISVPDRYASPADYKNYLKTYIDGAKQRGATPILVTPMGRRDFNADTGKFNVSFPEYVQAMKEVAAEKNVKLIDLSARSIAYYDSIGPEATLSVFLHVPAGIYQAFPNGATDNTHFQEYGAIQIARLVANGIRELGLPLSEAVKDAEVPAEVPAKPKDLRAGSIGNAGADLKWTDDETADIYKIYRKRAFEPESAYKLAGTATVPMFTMSGLTEGQSYSVRITGVNNRGESEPSDEVVLTTKSAAYRYDFGPEGSPVATGYTEVNRKTIYTPELGYGLTSSANMGDRDRGSVTDDLRRDFVIYFNGTYEFKVDLPNGTYSVKTYTGDWIGSTRTNVSIEGKDYGTVASGKGSIAEKVFTSVNVQDGQMNLVFGGQTAHLNGLEITPILMAPDHLKLDVLNLEEDPVTAALSWDGVEEASQYNVYRQMAGTSKSELLTTTAEPHYIDSQINLGMNYSYTVTALDRTGTESVNSNILEVSTIDSSVEKAEVPSGLILQNVNKNTATIGWNAAAGARSYQIYRSVKADGPFDLIGRTHETAYTDTTILSTIPYYYKVASVGVSELSAMLETPVVTKLTRDMEYLNRAPIAVQTDKGNYIGWRMLGLDPDSIAFNVYRDGEKLNKEPITNSTNYLDEEGKESSKYRVMSVVDDAEKAVTKEFGVWQQQYLSIPLQKPADDYTKDGQPYSYYAGDASVGDLDGDGEYEIVLMWSPNNAKDNSQSGYTGIVYMDAYKLDGTRLWRINMGPNIRAGAHYSPFLVYDFDGDGRAELMMRTADGTVDGQGKVIGDAGADHRNSSGYVLLGDEFLTVFDGETGAALDTVDYDPPRGDVSSWGDGYGNRVDRFLAAVAYVDGEHPSALFSRGYYTRTVLATYNFRDGKLSKVWRFDSNDEGYAEYAGQGNHNLSVGDVDGDGKDEITFGAMAIDDDGTPLYNTKLGHGDAMHLGDLDPAREGLEVFDVHEHKDAKYGMEMRDAATGEILWGVFTGEDTGRGMAADIDPNYPGAEVWASKITNAQHIPITGLYSARGELISTEIPSSTNFGVWWDGDLLRELQDNIRIDKWDSEKRMTVNLLTASGAASNNSTKANPSLQADLFGDWREEVMWRSQDSSELRIYTTTDRTEERMRTLMHDPIYRLGVAWQNAGYNQPPHTSFYLGIDMEKPAAPNIRYIGAPHEPEDTTPPVITGMPAERMNENEVLQVKVRAEDLESGITGLELKWDGEPVKQGDQISLKGLAGKHMFTARAVNGVGLITELSVEVTVIAVDQVAGPPGVPVLSSNNGHEDGLAGGNYSITMNMWWGNNGTKYKLYENGKLIDTQQLTASSPSAQKAVTEISGRVNGTYVYTCELINAEGVAESSPLIVKVTNAAPGKPVLSADNWDGDGNYTITINMWWGTNATSYRLYENGQEIDAQLLTEATPHAQEAKVKIEGRSPGEYEYVVEWINEGGTVTSEVLKVTVTHE